MLNGAKQRGTRSLDGRFDKEAVLVSQSESGQRAEEVRTADQREISVAVRFQGADLGRDVVADHEVPVARPSKRPRKDHFGGPAKHLCEFSFGRRNRRVAHVHRAPVRAESFVRLATEQDAVGLCEELVRAGPLPSSSGSVRLRRVT